MRYNLKRGLIAIVLLGCAAAASSVIVPPQIVLVAAPGLVAVESNVKKLHHWFGGIVGKLNVREGQRVTEGEVVVRLDDTQTRAELGIVVNKLSGLRAREVRLSAERDGLTSLTMPNDLLSRAKTEPDIQRMMDEEDKRFVTRRTMREGQKAPLAERIGQSRLEFDGYTELNKAATVVLQWDRDELEQLRQGYPKHPKFAARIAALERQVSHREESLGETAARIAQTLGKIAESERQIHQLDKDHATEIAKELREAVDKINKLVDHRDTVWDQLKQMDIRAPISGVVNQLAVPAIGGVIGPNERLMLIVPEPRLIVAVQISSADIADVSVGQMVRVRFPSFNQRVTPEVKGQLFRVAQDFDSEPQTGHRYYTGGVTLDDADVAKLTAKGLTLVAGIPVDAYIDVGSRTLACHFLRLLGRFKKDCWGGC
jgi:HlyD family secretion protein